MSQSRHDDLTARILAHARRYAADPDHDGADLAFEDPAFDAALVEAGPGIVEILGPEASRYLASLFIEAARVDDVPERPVQPKGRRDLGDCVAIEEHSLLFLPVSGTLSDLESYLATPGRSANLGGSLRQQSLMDPYSRIALYPGAWNAETLSRIGPGMIRRILDATIEARGTHSPASHQEALRRSVDAHVPQREDDADATLEDVVGGRCLVLHRIRNGYDDEPADGRGPIGSDLDRDPLLMESQDLADWARSEVEGRHLIFGQISTFLTARTRMTIGQVAVECHAQRLAHGRDPEHLGDCLYIYKDPQESDQLTFVVRYGDAMTRPVTVDAELAMGDMPVLYEEIGRLAHRYEYIADRAVFDAILQRAQP